MRTPMGREKKISPGKVKRSFRKTKRHTPNEIEEVTTPEELLQTPALKGNPGAGATTNPKLV